MTNPSLGASHLQGNLLFSEGKKKTMLTAKASACYIHVLARKMCKPKLMFLLLLLLLILKVRCLCVHVFITAKNCMCDCRPGVVLSINLLNKQKSL